MATFRQTRVLLFPLAVALAAAVAYVVTGSDRQAGPMLVFAVISLVIAVPVALMGRITVRGTVLHARGLWTSGESGVRPFGARGFRAFGPSRTPTLRHVIDLNDLVRVVSIGQKGGATAYVGPALMRERLLLEDRAGNQVMIWAWGWTRKRELFDLLKQAILNNHGHLDRLTARRLKITT